MRRVRVREHWRHVAGVSRRIAEHWRVIGSAQADPVRVARCEMTPDMFDADEIRMLQDLARQPDGSEITGRLLEVARGMRNY